MGDSLPDFAARTSAPWPWPVGVVDTGVDLHHPDLVDSLRGAGWRGTSSEPQFAMDQVGHGTAVAGLIAGTGAAGVHTGYCPGIPLISIAAWSYAADLRISVRTAVSTAVAAGARLIVLSASYHIPPGRDLAAEHSAWLEVGAGLIDARAVLVTTAPQALIEQADVSGGLPAPAFLASTAQFRQVVVPVTVTNASTTAGVTGGVTVCDQRFTTLRLGGDYVTGEGDSLAAPVVAASIATMAGALSAAPDRIDVADPLHAAERLRSQINSADASTCTIKGCALHTTYNHGQRSY